MNMTYSENAKKAGEAYTLLEKATALLEEVLGSSAGVVKGEWDRREDAKGHALFSLRISDPWTEPKSADFDPFELKSPDHMRVRLHRLWGDALQARSDRYLKQLQENGN